MKIRENMNAVIYARYSSNNQTEQSIEGQLHDAYEYAERVGYNVIGEYIDRALTGTKDTRPDFQRMIRDAEKHQFQIVIVWKLDRFARNRYDSAFYKQLLKKQGVRVVSVMENITDSPEGIILEGLLEAMAEYYSANLSENVRRGLNESRKKGWYCGGKVPLGYRLEDHKLVADERTAHLIPEIYQRYCDGWKFADMAADLNARGYRTVEGKKFVPNSFSHMIPNPTYIGEHTYKGEVIPGLAEPLIDKELYDLAVKRRAAHKLAPAAHRTNVHYILIGKIFCGCCGSTMSGCGGTSRAGKMYYYYACSARRHRKTGCKKKAERKDFLEWYVCEQTVEYVLNPERMDQIATAVADLYNSEIDDSKVIAMERTVRRLNDEINAMIDKMIYAPKELAPKIGERMQELELQRVEAETDLSKLRIQQRIRITKKEVTAWLQTFAKGDLFDEDFRIRIIDTFINSIYVWNDKIVIFYNIKGGQQTIKLDEISELDEKIEEEDGSPLNGKTYHKQAKGEPYFIFLHGMLGLVIFR